MFIGSIHVRDGNQMMETKKFRGNRLFIYHSKDGKQYAY